ERGTSWARLHRTVRTHGALERTDGRRADGDDAPTRRPRGGDGGGGTRRHVVPFCRHDVIVAADGQERRGTDEERERHHLDAARGDRGEEMPGEMQTRRRRRDG